MNNLNQKYLKLEKRLERALVHGRFMQFSRKKQAQLARRLKGISLQLKRSLKPTIATAFLTLGLLGTANAQITFTQQTTHPLSSINEDDSTPAFVDIDNDGDYDCFIGFYDGTVDFYLNTGTATAPTFQLQTTNPLSAVSVNYNAKLDFVDIDGDGDMDCFVGSFDGDFLYYQNTGSASSPTFTAQTGANNPLNGFDVGLNSGPRFIDLDNDGDMDCVSAHDYGVVRYYQNNGGTFTEQTGASNPFNFLNLGVNSQTQIDFADLDKDGDLDLFLHHRDVATGREVRYYRNDGTASIPNFGVQVIGVANPFDSFDDKIYAPRFVDIDGDGDMDCFAVTLNETMRTINYFRNDSPVSILELEQKTLALYPNPAATSINFNQAQTGSLELYNNLGQLIHSEILDQELHWNIPSDLNNGLYQLILRTEDAIWTNQIQLQR